MTVAEKIKFYRNANKLTQKRLAELSGVSEISICKYEAGERNPKIEQLRKIANAMTIGREALLEDDAPAVKIETVGDFMKCFYAMMESIDCEFLATQSPEGHVGPLDILVRFNNPKIAKCLDRIVTEDAMSCKDPSVMVRSEDGVVNIEQALTDKFLRDLTKKEFMESQEPLQDT
ncbi:helix-turn-helix transcriptional regulator [Bengtsoniella intestinalis]|uniref:helix-turn-helix domain-containing protein n=1 Tax=Bengtsoniella intestinalis TaxID=3073143 RepID=UPI00391FA307